MGFTRRARGVGAGTCQRYQPVARPSFGAAAAQLAAGEVERNSGDPGSQRPDVLAPKLAFPGAGERLLHRVLGGRQAPAYELDRADDLAVLAPNELSDPLFRHRMSVPAPGSRRRERWSRPS